jgi:hypothetical protein
MPRADVILKLAREFNTSIEFLITGKDETGLNQEEKDLIASFRTLDRDDKDEIIGLIQLKIYNQKKGENLSNTGTA